MSHLITSADLVIPVFLIIVLGYAAGRRGMFSGDGAVALNHLVIEFALPATLFVGTVAETRSALAQQLPLFGLLAIGLLGLDLLVLMVLRYAIGLELHLSALLALTATQPMFAFMGIPVLTGVLGHDRAALPIAISGVVVNVVMVPLAVVLLQHPASSTSPHRVRSPDGPGAASSTDTRLRSNGPGIGVLLTSTFAQPIVWAPILAFAIVLAAVPVPKILDDSLTLLGGASSGVALLFVGVTSAQTKSLRLTLRGAGLVVFSLLIAPMVVLAVGRFARLDPTIAHAAVLTVAFPISPVPLLLARKYDAQESGELSSALVISVMLSILTLPIWL